MEFQNQLVDQRRKDITEQDGEHHPLRESRVDDADQNAHRTDQEAVDPLALLSHGPGHRVGGHEDQAERQTAEHQVPVRAEPEHRVGAAAD